MAALTKERNTKQLDPNVDPPFFGLPVAASTKIYQGGIVCDNGSGYAEPGSTSTTIIAVGRAEQTVDNSSGSAGDKKVRVKRGVFRYANSSGGDEITIAERWSACYIVDDQTVAKTDGTSTRSLAGIVVDVDSSGVWVLIGATNAISNAADTATVSAHDTHLKNSAAYVPLSLYDLREVDGSGDVGAIAANGGILASDTDPILRGDSNESQEVSWATGNTDKVAFQTALPTDLNHGEDVVLELWVSSGTTDAATFTVETGWDGGSLVSDTADDSGTKSATMHKITATIAAADVPADPALLTVILTPGSHASDTIQLHGMRLTYTRELLT